MARMATQAAALNGFDERKAARVPLRLAVVMKCDKHPTQQVTLTDLTRFGCQVATHRRVTVGTFVTLDIPGYVDVFGWVAWTHGSKLGIDFAHALPPGVMAHIASLGS